MILVMTRLRQLLRFFSRPLIGLVTLGVFAAPILSLPSFALAAKNSCGSSCPCHREHQLKKAADPCCDGNSEKQPNKKQKHQSDGDPCPQDCPDCSCSVGVVVGVSSFEVAGFLSDVSNSSMAQPRDQRLSGSTERVFRPPRTFC